MSGTAGRHFYLAPSEVAVMIPDEPLRCSFCRVDKVAKRLGVRCTDCAQDMPRYCSEECRRKDFEGRLASGSTTDTSGYPSGHRLWCVAGLRMSEYAIWLEQIFKFSLSEDSALQWALVTDDFPDQRLRRGDLAVTMSNAVLLPDSGFDDVPRPVKNTTIIFTPSNGTLTAITPPTSDRVPSKTRESRLRLQNFRSMPPPHPHYPVPPQFAAAAKSIGIIPHGGIWFSGPALGTWEPVDEVTGRGFVEKGDFVVSYGICESVAPSTAAATESERGTRVPPATDRNTGARSDRFGTFLAPPSYTGVPHGAVVPAVDLNLTTGALRVLGPAGWEIVVVGKEPYQEGNAGEVKGITVGSGMGGYEEVEEVVRGIVQRVVKEKL